MARDLLMVERVGSPSAAAFETAMNAILAPLLSQLIGTFEIVVTDKLPASTRLIKGLLDIDSTGGTVITHPYLVKVIEAYDDVSVVGIAEAFMAANPSYWFSPTQYHYTDQLPNVSNRSMLFLLYNTNAADGAANWDPGYIAIGGGGATPTGPAGGDLSGTYPDPVVGPRTTGQVASGAIPASITALDSQAVATYQDLEWELVLTKGTTRYSTTVRANISDGVTPVWQEDGVTIAPAIGGTFDFTITVDISGGNMRLLVTPVTTGWSARTRTRALAV